MKKWAKSLTILAVLFLIFGIFIQSVYADKEELEKIKQAIKEKGAKWDADETSVSELPDDQFKMMLGAIFPTEPSKGAKTRTMGVTTPTSLDWRSNGGNYVTSVKNQGSCGSCWAFGTIASAESLDMIAHNNPVIRVKGKAVDPIDLSEQDLVSCCSHTDAEYPGWNKCDSCLGCDPYWAYEYLKTTGVPGESCFPYADSNTAETPTSIPCITTCPVLVHIVDWSVLTQGVDSLEGAVLTHPIPVGFNVYSDFGYYRSGVYQHVSGVLRGGHMVCLIGWNNNPPPEGKGKNSFTPPPYFICKNSWGSWGESGFFRIAQSETGPDTLVNFGARAADFSLEGLAPPKLAKPAAVVTLWGSIKSSY